MLERHVIVSGTNAGRPGPLRPTSGCSCDPCAVWRTEHNDHQRERYAADAAFRQRRREGAAERRLEHGEAINALARSRYLIEPAYAEQRRRASLEWSRRNAERVRAAVRARYRRLRPLRELAQRS